MSQNKEEGFQNEIEEYKSKFDRLSTSEIVELIRI